MNKKQKSRIIFLTLFMLFALCIGTSTVFAGEEDHEYGTPKFEWSNDFNVVKAIFTCKNNPAHVRTIERCNITVNTKIRPTCTENGLEMYTATCNLGGKVYSDSIERVLRATGHKYGEPKFTWSDDYSSATATFVCEYDSSHVSSVDCTVTTDTIKPTCTKNGKTVYTASSDFEDKTYADIKEKNLSATGHVWKNGKCTNCGLIKANAKHTKEVSESAKEDSASSNSPETGDTNNLLAYIFTMIASAGAIGGLNIRRRNHNK